MRPHAMPETLDQWLEHLEALHPVGIDLGLERVAQVAERMGLISSSVSTPATSPAPSLIAPRVITVAGTNGKGSTLAMIEAVAAEHGLRVGSYTSPHLLRYNERVRLDGHEADDALLCRGFEAVERARLQVPAISLTYFEAGTLCAFWCLATAELDLAVLEVGLGGRLDAVNIVDADVAIVTTIALDHATFLGTDLAQIGREKAGIFRAGKPAVLGSQALPGSVAEEALRLNAPCYALGEAFSRSDVSEDGWAWQGQDEHQAPLSLSALPDPGLPLDNAATALQALSLAGIALDAAKTRQALSKVTLAGRMQWLGQWCVDVGHNPHAATYLATRLPDAPEGGQWWGLLGMLNDKDADGVIAPLVARIPHWVCVSLDGERGRSAEELAARITRLGGTVHHCAASPEAGAAWLAPRLATQDRVLATGSFFTVAALLAMPLPASA